MTHALRGTLIREGLRPGDLDAIVSLHGQVYASEYGFDASFEAYVADPLNTFALSSGDGGKIWIAENAKKKLLGSIAIVRTDDGKAHLRWFILAPDTRGRGLGRSLCNLARTYIDLVGFEDVTLWTFEGLDAAMRLYRDMGFVEIARKPGVLGGQPVMEIQMKWTKTSGK